MKDLGKPSVSLALYPAPAFTRVMAARGRQEEVLMTNSELREYLRTRLGIAHLSTEKGTCVICGKEVLNRDEHILACMHGGHRTACHNRVKAATMAYITDSGFRPREEVMLFHDQRRLDIVVDLGGTTFALDITVVSPLTSTTTKPAVVAAAEGKRAKYESSCREVGVTFVPFAFDMWGNRCKEVEDFIRKVQAESSALYPHLNHSLLAAQTRISMGLAKAVGSLLSAHVKGQPARRSNRTHRLKWKRQ